MVASEKIRDFYNNFATYLAKDKIYDNPRHDAIHALVRDVVARRRFASALDVGCGIGITSRHIRRYVPDVLGIDISDANIRFARQTVRNVAFVRADFLEVDLGRKFELITLFDVLEHIPQDRRGRVFERVVESCNQDSWVLITIPNPDYLDFCRKHAPDKLQIVDESIHFNDLLAHLDSSGFEIVEYRTYGIDYEDQYRSYLLRSRGTQFVLREKRRASGKGLRLLRAVYTRVRGLARILRYRKALRELSRTASSDLRVPK